MLRIFLIALFVLLASGIGKAAHGEELTVAVLYFDNNSGDERLDVLSKGFADMLITDISGTGTVTVVEREKLQALLNESKLQRSKFFDRKTAVKIGKGLGAKYVLSGSFMEVKPRLRIDIRMIDVATGAVVLATQVKGDAEDVFELEQKLVGDFLSKLNHKFFAARLPPTKVPNLEALVSYSQGLALIDKGEDAKAAALMKKLIKKAPAFGLARSKHAALVLKLAESSVRRDAEIDKDQKALYAEARAYVDSRRLSSLDKQEANHYLAYRTLIGLEYVAALHPTLGGRRHGKRAVPRKGAKAALGFMKAYYNNQRLLIEETNTLSARHGRLSPRLPNDSQKIASTLKLNTSDSQPAETMLDFLLHGRAPTAGSLKYYTIVPAFADIDPKMKKAALALAKARLALVTPPGQLSLDAHQIRVLETLADWHIRRSRVEKGIGELQTILDRFPRAHRWSQIETRIQEELGLKSSHIGRQRSKFEKGLRGCDPRAYNAALHTIIAERVNSMGLQAIVFTEKELKKQCGTAQKYDQMKNTLYRSAMLTAAKYGDCEWFDLYIKKWQSVGGSSSDARGYRKNYSDCH